MPSKDAYRIVNSVDPDQTVPLGAVWSESTLFAQIYLSENLEVTVLPKWKEKLFNFLCINYC